LRSYHQQEIHQLI